MAYNTKSIVKDINEKPIPQHFNPAADEYQVVQGRNGASRVELYDKDGNPVDLDALVAPIEAELATIKAQLAAVLNVSVDNLPETQQVAGEVSISNIPATQQVAGTVDVGNLPESYDVVDSVARTELAAIKAQLADVVNVQLTGSKMEYYGATVAERPAVATVPIGATYMAVNSSEVWQSNGTDWVVLA